LPNEAKISTSTHCAFVGQHTLWSKSRIGEGSYAGLFIANRFYLISSCRGNGAVLARAHFDKTIKD
jgi:hypothetical protein